MKKQYFSFAPDAEILVTQEDGREVCKYKANGFLISWFTDYSPNAVLLMKRKMTLNDVIERVRMVALYRKNFEKQDLLDEGNAENKWEDNDANREWLIKSVYSATNWILHMENDGDDFRIILAWVASSGPYKVYARVILKKLSDHIIDTEDC